MVAGTAAAVVAAVEEVDTAVVELVVEIAAAVVAVDTVVVDNVAAAVAVEERLELADIAVEVHPAAAAAAAVVLEVVAAAAAAAEYLPAGTVPVVPRVLLSAVPQSSLPGTVPHTTLTWCTSV